MVPCCTSPVVEVAIAAVSGLVSTPPESFSLCLHLGKTSGSHYRQGRYGRYLACGYCHGKKCHSHSFLHSLFPPSCFLKSLFFVTINIVIFHLETYDNVVNFFSSLTNIFGKYHMFFQKKVRNIVNKF